MGFRHVEQTGLKLLASGDLPTLVSQSVGITGVSHHNWLIFVFLVQMRFHQVGQAGLQLLTSGDPPISAAQRAGITDMRYHTWLIFLFLVEMGFTMLTRMVSISRPREPPASASQSAGTTGVSHCIRPPKVLGLQAWAPTPGLPKCWDYRRGPLRSPLKTYF